MNSRLKQCEMCGEFMSDTTGHTTVCYRCVDEDAELFDRVKATLKYGEKVPVGDLANRSGVDKRHIERWVKSGRLGSGSIDV